MENAIKYTRTKGSVRIEAAAGAPLAGRPTVLITVADTGMGIPAGEVPQLFDRFFRATNAQDEAVPGTGLGLAIVHGIVKAHHGEISVTSVLGKGTTIGVTFPVGRPAGSPGP